MLVARKALVSTSPNVGPHLEGVISDDLGPIRHTLVLEFLFVQWAVALIAHLKSGGAVNVQLGKPPRIFAVGVIKARNAYLRG